MAPLTIPADIRRFVVGNIGSVPQLEALLLLRHHEERDWTPAQLSARLYVGEADAAHLLERLHAAGFLSRGDTELYRFAPGDEFRELVARLDDFYARNLVAITQLIHSNDARRAHAFADAFKLRKEP